MYIYPLYKKQQVKVIVFLFYFRAITDSIKAGEKRFDVMLHIYPLALLAGRMLGWVLSDRLYKAYTTTWKTKVPEVGGGGYFLLRKVEERPNAEQ